MVIQKPVLLSFVSLIMFVGMSLSVQAQSVCKGLDADACESNAACGLVNGYTRKDGREVKAFCRTSSKGKIKKSVQKES